jgi:hypothetical protein
LGSTSSELGSATGLDKKLQDDQEKKLLAFLEESFTSMRSGRLDFERQWYMNLAFYFGKQYVQWNATASGTYSKLYVPAAPAWRVRLVSNKVRPIIRKELAKITKERPQAFVIPASADDDDLMAAQAGEAIYEHISRDIGINALTRRVEFWAALCGSSFAKVWYDPSMVDSSGMMGAICAEPVTPFHLFVSDYAEETLENQSQITQVMTKSVDFVEQAWGKRVSADAGLASNGLLESKFLQALGIKVNKRLDQVAVKETWIKPGVYKDYPQGTVIWWAGQTVLKVHEGWPYEHGQAPFTKFDHIPAGRFYADSVIVDLIPLQKEYNRTRSQIVESKNRTSKPQIIAVKGSINPQKVTSEPGLIIEYQPGFNPPQPLPPQPLPGYVLQECDRIQKDMDDISFQHEISKGDAPGGVEAATAIAYLQEEDDTALSYTISSLEEGTEKMGRHFLGLAKQYWSAERTVKVTGDSGTWESYMFGSGSLSTDLRIQAGSATPRSKAAKQAYIMELGKLGWIPPDKALRYLDMAETSRMYDEMQVDIRQAQRENMKMAKGLPVTVNTWDEHAVHIYEHNLYRKKQSFEKLPPELKAQFEAHVKMHQMVMAMTAGQPLPPGDPRLDAVDKMLAMQPGYQGATMPGAPMPGPPVGVLPSGGPNMLMGGQQQQQGPPQQQGFNGGGSTVT